MQASYASVCYKSTFTKVKIEEERRKRKFCKEKMKEKSNNCLTQTCCGPRNLIILKAATFLTFAGKLDHLSQFTWFLRVTVPSVAQVSLLARFWRLR